MLREAPRAAAQWFVAIFGALTGLWVLLELETALERGIVLVILVAWAAGCGSAAMRKIVVSASGVALRYCTHYRRLQWNEISTFQVERRFILDRRPVVVTVDGRKFGLPGIDRFSLLGGQEEKGWSEHVGLLEKRLRQARASALEKESQL